MDKKPSEPRTPGSPKEDRGASRKEYVSPRLVAYGGLLEIVQMNKGASRKDGGGAPQTKR